MYRRPHRLYVVINRYTCELVHSPVVQAVKPRQGPLYGVGLLATKALRHHAKLERLVSKKKLI